MFNLTLDEILMIGDTAHDFEVANAIDIDCILFFCSMHTIN